MSTQVHEMVSWPWKFLYHLRATEVPGENRKRRKNNKTQQKIRLNMPILRFFSGLYYFFFVYIIYKKSNTNNKLSPIAFQQQLIDGLLGGWEYTGVRQGQ